MAATAERDDGLCLSPVDLTSGPRKVLQMGLGVAPQIGRSRPADDSRRGT
jgi:hypothetical protein